MKSIQRPVLTVVAARQTTDLGTSCEKTSGKRLANTEGPVQKDSRIRQARAVKQQILVHGIYIKQQEVMNFTW